MELSKSGVQDSASDSSALVSSAMRVISAMELSRQANDGDVQKMIPVTVPVGLEKKQ